MPNLEKWNELEALLESLGANQDTIIEKFIQGSGSGGQKINKTHSCVYLKHTTSGIEIKCQTQRSRELNRFIARKELAQRLQEIKLGKQTANRHEQEKIRRQKRKRSQRSKNRMLDAKSKNSQKKNLRKPPKRHE